MTLLISASAPVARSRPEPLMIQEQGSFAVGGKVITNPGAVQMNMIIRAFVKLRELLATHQDLARKITELEGQQKQHGEQLSAVYSMVKRLIDVPINPKRRIGFPADAKN